MREDKEMQTLYQELLQKQRNFKVIPPMDIRSWIDPGIQLRRI